MVHLLSLMMRWSRDRQFVVVGDSVRKACYTTCASGSRDITNSYRQLYGTDSPIHSLTHSLTRAYSLGKFGTMNAVVLNIPSSFSAFLSFQYYREVHTCRPAETYLEWMSCIGTRFFFREFYSRLGDLYCTCPIGYLSPSPPVEVFHDRPWSHCEIQLWKPGITRTFRTPRGLRQRVSAPCGKG